MSTSDPNRYRIERKLGAGGRGAVYQAEDTLLARPVAIKVLDDLPGEAHGSVLREARAASALNHPNICTVHEVAELDGRPCIVMEFVDGQSLADAIPPGGFAADLVLSYGRQIADALTHAHERGVIHRDLKSANVMVTSDGRIKVLDFGLARRQRDDERYYATEIDTSQTPASPASGTLPYMSPETIAGKPPRTDDDLWAFGVLLYELASGELPFQGATRFELAASIQRDEPAPLPSRVPAGLRAVVLRLLSRDPTERYRDPREARAALDALQAGAATRTRSARRPRLSTAALLAALVITIAGAAIWKRPDASPAPPGPPAPSVGRPLTIAVLPFESANNDPALDYLANGIPESIIKALGRIPDKVAVRGWAAVQQYRGAVDLRSVGEALASELILRGSVVQRQDGVLVTSELIRLPDGHSIWSGSFRAAGLLALQKEIATGISTKLGLSLTTREQDELVRDHPASDEAMHLFLRGLYHSQKFTPADYRRSLDHFNEAIALDPTYALAWAWIARMTSSMAYEGLLPPRAFEDAERAALEALKIDKTLGAAFDARAHVKFAYRWDPRAAEKDFLQALQLDPRDETIHRFYAVFLRNERRWKEAVTHIKIALDIRDSPEARKALGATYLWAGQYDEAIGQFDEALKLNPAYADTFDLLADAYAAKGMFQEALRARRDYLRLEGAYEAAEALGSDGSESGYRRGMTNLYRRYLAKLNEDASKGEAVSPLEFALTYIGLGETEPAFKALDEAYRAHAPWLASLEADPVFDPIRSDERFAKLVAKVRVPYRSF